MGRRLTIELDETDFQRVRKAASAAGAVPEAWVADQVKHLLSPHGNVFPGFDALLPEFRTAAQQMARRHGGTAEEQAQAWWERTQPKADTETTDAEPSLSLERHFGAIRGGEAHGADNERIDRDLAAEYGADSEEAA